MRVFTAHLLSVGGVALPRLDGEDDDDEECLEAGEDEERYDRENPERDVQRAE